jgi:hypothetical protein
MRRVETGEPFRSAYRAVAAALARGERFPAPARAALMARRKSTGNLGNLGLPRVRSRLRARRAWAAQARRRFETALTRLAGARR